MDNVNTIYMVAQYVFTYNFALSTETSYNDLYSQSLPVNPGVHKNLFDFNVQQISTYVTGLITGLMELVQVT